MKKRKFQILVKKITAVVAVMGMLLSYTPTLTVFASEINETETNENTGDISNEETKTEESDVKYENIEATTSEENDIKKIEENYIEQKIKEDVLKDKESTTSEKEEPKITVNTKTQKVSAPSNKSKVEFEDSLLEKYMIARYDENEDGEITNEEMELIDYLELGYYDGIDAGDITSLKGIENATNATRFFFYTYKNVDLTPILEMDNITDIEIGGSNYDISKIASKKNLEKLKVIISSSDFIPDLSPISRITTLKNLSISDYFENTTLDASIINNKPNLEFLSLRGNIININAISSATNLSYLEVCSNGKISDISFVSGLNNLRTLNLDGNKITDITPLKSLENVSYISLLKNPINPEEKNNKNTIETLKAKGVTIELDEYDSSEVIQFEDENFKKYLIENVRADLNNDGEITTNEMEQLDYVTISIPSNKPFTSIDEIKYAKNLESLWISKYSSYSKISINSIKELTSLKTLSLQGNFYIESSEYEVLENLTNLENLYLSVYSSDVDINKLHNCTNLKTLQINSYGKIDNISGLSNFKSLTRLTMSNSGQYSSIDAKEITDNVNKSIQEIELQGKLSNINSLWNLKNLMRLSLRSNYSSGVADFSGIENLKELVYLDIEGFDSLSSTKNLECIKKINGLKDFTLDFGYIYSDNSSINEEKIIDIIENVNCESVRLGGNYTVTLQGVTCNSNRTIKFEDLGPIMKAVITPGSKLYKENIELSKDSYNDGSKYIEIDNTKRTITLNTDDEKGKYYTQISTNADYSESGFRGGLRLEWINLKLDENPEDVNIPDEKLKEVLLDKYDLDGDKKITTNDMSNITELDLSNCGIKDLTGLETAVDLHNLILNQNEVTDLTPLASLKSLYGLEASHNKISDLSPIKELLIDKENEGGATWAVFTDNYITSLKGLEDINFNDIDLTYNYLDVSEGSENYKIIENQIRKSAEKDFNEHPEWFDDDYNLEEDISNRIERIIVCFGRSKYGTPAERDDILTFDSKVKKVLVSEGYDINNDGKISKGELSDNDVVTKLDLSNMNLSNIDNLKYLNKLRELKLSNNSISDITPLKYCKCLTKIDLSNNKISNINSIKDFHSVIELDLSNNTISDMTPIGNMKYAQKRYTGEFYSGGWEDIRELTINLSNNKISNISAINKLTTLNMINLSGNNVSDISSLANYDFNKLYEGLDEMQLQWVEITPVTVDLSSNHVKVDSTGSKNAIKHFEDNNSTIKLDNQTELAFKKGDVNGDGNITLIDCTKILAHIKGTKLLTEEEQQRADVTGDGKITVADCARILAHIKGTKTLE